MAISLLLLVGCSRKSNNTNDPNSPGSSSTPASNVLSDQFPSDQNRFVIPEVIEANGVDWGTRRNPIVFIRDYDGCQNLVDPDVISTGFRLCPMTSRTR